MTAVHCDEQRMPGGFEHSAVLYQGLEGLVDSVVPFAREGVERGEPVLVALLPERGAAVREALGSRSRDVEFLDMAALGANPARIIPAWRHFVDTHEGAGPVRGVGEPVWSGRRPAELEEAALHEALLNVAFDGGPPWQLMCPYDVAALPDAVIEEAVRNHPRTSGADATASYAGSAYGRERFSASLPAAPDVADAMPFGADDLAGLRSTVTVMAARAGLDAATADDLVLAAHEVSTNSILHGGGKGFLRAWTEQEALVVEISDAGVIDDPLVGREALQQLSEGGRGVWMANQLCDLVQVRSGAEGTVVRLHTWL